MKFTEKKQKLDYLIKLIEKEKTGTAKDLCENIYVSKRTLERFIADLRDLGFPISFCSLRKTYYIVKENE